jgi:lantibiotic modifying enzyme
LEGKMGISIFFFHYSVYSKKKIYKQFADELIKEIYREVNTGHSFYFVDGLSGVARGMEYLVRNMERTLS